MATEDTTVRETALQRCLTQSQGMPLVGKSGPWWGNLRICKLEQGYLTGALQDPLGMQGRLAFL